MKRYRVEGVCKGGLVIWGSMQRGDVERGCTEEVERKCQRGVVIQGGLSSDRWGAQRRLSCTMTVSYNAEYVESGCRKRV